MSADRSGQEQLCLDIAAANRIRATLNREPCPVAGCTGCWGWASTGELHARFSVHNARISTLRKAGWVIERVGDKSEFGIFHFLRQVPVQRDLATGEELRHIGDLPVGIGGKMVEFFEVGR